MRRETGSEAGLIQIGETCSQAVSVPAPNANKHFPHVWLRLLNKGMTGRVIVEAPR